MTTVFISLSVIVHALTLYRLHLLSGRIDILSNRLTLRRERRRTLDE